MSEEKAGQSQTQGDEPKSADVQSFSVRSTHHLLRRLPLPTVLRHVRVWVPLAGIILVLIGVGTWLALRPSPHTPASATQPMAIIPHYTKAQIKAAQQHQVLQGTITAITATTLTIKVQDKTTMFTLTPKTAYYQAKTFQKIDKKILQVGHSASVTYYSAVMNAESVWYD